MKRYFIVKTIFVIIFFLGCVSKIPSPQQRTARLLKKISEKNYSYAIYKNKDFDIFGVYNQKKCNDTMRIYIEGDGLAWITANRVSSNPTPLNPIAFKLFMLDENCAIYLARPCQYFSHRQCFQKYWTSARFSRKIIQNYMQTLDKIKKDFKIKKFYLIGYSGGGAIAAILAAKRDDVKKLITVAGNLNIKLWWEIHRITPLKNSLNPIDYANNLKKISQIHIVGSNDSVIPEKIIDTFILRVNSSKIKKIVLPNATHTNGWVSFWKDFNKRF